MSGRRCSLCARPDLVAIEAALVAGTPLRAIASTFATTPGALHRHRAAHMARAGAGEPVEAVPAPVAPTPPAASPPPPVPASGPPTARLVRDWDNRMSAARLGDRCGSCQGNHWWELPDGSRGGCARCVPLRTRRVRRFET